MKKLIFTFLLLLLLPNLQTNAQGRQATHISFAAICDGQIGLWDNETAVLMFNPATQALTVYSDIYEITDSHTRYEHPHPDDINGIPITITSRLSIPDLDFKSAKNNGETYQFVTTIQCNGKEKQVQATYTFVYAPKVAVGDAPICSFRIDVALSMNPIEFGLETERGCDEIVIRIQDGLLNRID